MKALVVGELGSGQDKESANFYLKMTTVIHDIVERLSKKFIVVQISFVKKTDYLPPDYDFYVIHGDDATVAAGKIPPEKLKCCVYVSSPHANAINTPTQLQHWGGSKMSLGSGKLFMRYPPDHFNFASVDLKKLDRMLSDSFIVQKNTRKQLFHISLNGELEGVWKPQSPTGAYTQADRIKLAKEIEEEQKHGVDYQTVKPWTETLGPRICLSDNIQGCFSGVYPAKTISDLFSNGKTKFIDFFVYYPKDYKDKDIMSPEELTRMKQVWDAHVTREYCLFSDTLMLLYPLKLRVHAGDALGEIKARLYNTEGKLEYHSPKIRYTWIPLGGKTK